MLGRKIEGAKISRKTEKNELGGGDGVGGACKQNTNIKGKEKQTTVTEQRGDSVVSHKSSVFLSAFLSASISSPPGDFTSLPAPAESR